MKHNISSMEATNRFDGTGTYKIYTDQKDESWRSRHQTQPRVYSKKNI